MTVPDNRPDTRRYRPMPVPRGAAASWLPPGARGVRLSDSPALSAVIASTGPHATLDSCLNALRSQCRAYGAEIVVVRACDQSELESLQLAHPDVRFVGAAPDTPVAHLRATGAATAEGDIVALLEDRALPPPDLIAHLATGGRHPGSAAPRSARPGV